MRVRHITSALALGLVSFQTLGGCGQTPAEPTATTNPPNATIATGEDSTIDVATERYHGLFGDSASPTEMMGTYVITDARPPRMADHFPELPRGAIMIGAMWADVAPWYMVAESPTRFQQILASDFAPPVTAVFELNADGDAVALTIEGLPDDPFGKRARIGDVPVEYR